MSHKLVSLLGLLSFIAFAWALSTDRKRFPWRTVLWGLGLQLALAKSFGPSNSFVFAISITATIIVVASKLLALPLGPVAAGCARHLVGDETRHGHQRPRNFGCGREYFYGPN